jgi:YfiH family protein
MKSGAVIFHPEFEATNIIHGFLTRNIEGSTNNYCNKDDDLPETDLAKLAHNHDLALSAAGIANKKLLILKQVHGKQVINANLGWEIGAEPSADGFVTNNPDFALGIVTADCAPILLADAKNGIVGAAHSGWKSARLNIAKQVVQEMIALGAEIEEIKAVIGPCIHQNSYEVGLEFFEVFMDENSQNIRFFQPSVNDNHFMFDLPGYVMKQLKALDLKIVTSINGDTYSNEELFFSFRLATHRKTKLEGCLLSIIALS